MPVEVLRNAAWHCSIRQPHSRVCAINCDQQLVQQLVNMKQHNLIRNPTTRTIRILMLSTINIGLTAPTEDEAMDTDAEDQTNGDEAPRVTMDTTMATATIVDQSEEVITEDD